MDLKGLQIQGLKYERTEEWVIVSYPDNVAELLSDMDEEGMDVS